LPHDKEDATWGEVWYFAGREALKIDVVEKLENK